MELRYVPVQIALLAKLWGNSVSYSLCITSQILKNIGVKLQSSEDFDFMYALLSSFICITCFDM